MPLRELLKSHPLLALLGWRGPRSPSVQRTVDALCAHRDGVTVDPNGEVKGLPTDGVLAQRLGLSESTIRKNLEHAETKVRGLEELPMRSRIYFCYWHDKWLAELQTAPRRTPLSTPAVR